MTQGAVLCGFFGRRNLGDEAILAGMLDLLATARPGEIPLVMSADPSSTRQDHGVPAVLLRDPAVRPRAPRALATNVRALRSRSHFVLGGGDLLRDSPTQDVASAWLSQLALAQRLGRRTAVIGVSVGEVWRPSTIDRIRRVVSRTSFVVVRDDASRERLAELDVQAPVHVALDLALRVFRRAESTGSGADGARRVVVSVRGLADRGDPAATRAHRAALGELAAALDELASGGARIELVPLRSYSDRYQPVDDDYVASLELAHLAQRGHEFVVHRHVASLGELRELVSAADLVIGMRLHSVIVAAGLGVPVVALAYDSKVTGFCREAGISECLALEGLDAPDMLAAADSATGRRAPGGACARWSRGSWMAVEQQVARW